MAINNPAANAVIRGSTNKYSQYKHFTFIIVLISLAASLASCITMADPEASQDYTTDIVADLNSQTTIGQTFVSRRPNLSSISIWLTRSADQAAEKGAGSINVYLYPSPGVSAPVFSTVITAPASGSNLPVEINLPNQKNPGDTIYFLLLSASSGAIKINGRNEDIYPHGQAYINSEPVNADISFRLSYDYDLAALLEDGVQFIKSSWIVIPLLILLILPGWLLLSFSGFLPRFDTGERVAISAGVSLALVPIVMLWTTVVKFSWSQQKVLFAAGFIGALLIVRLISSYLIPKLKPRKNSGLFPLDDFVPGIKKNTCFLPVSLLLILVFLGNLAVRLIMVRDLATPAWVDSVHHALITRLILDSGALPATYMPYLDIPSTAYHPGFHSIAAIFIWLSDLELPQAMLIFGQILNALSVFSVYLITKTITRSSTAGLCGAFVTGFLTPMPAYYTSWGRYTELTGLLIMPVVLALIHLWSEEQPKVKSAWIVIMGAVAAGGLFMIHYRVIVFLGSLLLSYTLFSSVSFRKNQKSKLLYSIYNMIILVAVSMIMVLPWLLPTIRGTFLPKINLPAAQSVSFFQDFSWPYLTSALGKQAMVIAGMGLLWSLIKRPRIALSLLSWIVLLFFLANLDALHLTGGGLITNLSVEIMLFIPISLLAGYFIDQVLINWLDLIPKRLILPSWLFTVFLFGIAALWGARQLIPILNPTTILSRKADLPAIEWVNTHIPKNETIVINPFAWGYGLFAGMDGGYWLSPLTGNQTIPPPVIYGLGKNIKVINQQAQQIISASVYPGVLRELLVASKIHYVFIGVRGGVISPEKLEASGLFDEIYHQEGVSIFRVKP